MQLFYKPDIQENNTLSEQESKHCVRVLRMQQGDILKVIDLGLNFSLDFLLVFFINLGLNFSLDFILVFFIDLGLDIILDVILDFDFALFNILSYI